MRSIFRVAILMLVLLWATACQPATPTPTPVIEPTNTPMPTVGPMPTLAVIPRTISSDPQEQAFVRVVHAAAQLDTLDVYVELLGIGTNLDFSRSTGRTSIGEGEYTLRVVPSRGNPDTDTILTSPISLQGGDSWIFVLTQVDGELQLGIFPEVTEALGQGESRVAMIQAIPDAGEVRMLNDGQPVSEAAPFDTASPPDILPAGRGNITFQSGATTLLEYPIDLRERYNYTLVLVGSENAPQVANLDVSVGGTASLRILNASSAVGGIDVVVDGERIAQNLTFATMTTRLPTLADQHLLEVYATGADPNSEEPLFSGQIRPNLDDHFVAAVIGPADDLQVVTYEEDIDPTARNASRIAALNTLPAHSYVNFELAAGPITGLPEANYGQGPRFADITAGRFDFYTTAADESLVETAEGVQLEPGMSYLYLITGAFNAPVIVSEEVGVDESLGDINALAQPTPAIPTTPTALRFVNAMSAEMPVDFAVDGSVLANVNDFGQGTAAIPVEVGAHVIELRSPGVATALASAPVNVQPGVTYSVFAYMPDGTNPRLLVVSDEDLRFDAMGSHIRLVNLSEEAIRLGLMLSQVDPIRNNVPTPVPGSLIVPTTAEGSDFPAFRRSIPFGARAIIDDVSGSSASGNIVIPFGTRNMEIIDVEQNLLALTIANVTLELGQHYDVIAFQEANTPRVRGLVLQYPRPLE
ncbi:MAG: DUF4397 domain-containing protein [Burkholderiales bacterium]|nr:DUF4397 domain-containing protein [Anaerolineae bacterium]